MKLVNVHLEKAKKAYFSLKNLFHSRVLNRKVKILCYVLFIRPILTYGCQVWFNISASTIEKLRKFERNCLRACLNMYKSPHSNYERYYSNEDPYKVANINRIDNFILKLTRDHVTNSSNIFQILRYLVNSIQIRLITNWSEKKVIFHTMLSRFWIVTGIFKPMKRYQ